MVLRYSLSLGSSLSNSSRSYTYTVQVYITTLIFPYIVRLHFRKHWNLHMRREDLTKHLEILRDNYLQDKLLVDVAFGHGRLEIWALQEAQKELIHQLEPTCLFSNIHLCVTVGIVQLSYSSGLGAFVELQFTLRILSDCSKHSGWWRLQMSQV